MEYLNKGEHLQVSDTTLIASGSADKILLKTVHLTNVSETDDVTINLFWTDNSSGEDYYLGKNILLPVNSSFQALDGTFTLNNLDSLKANCSVDNSVDITISYMSITNDEG